MKGRRPRSLLKYSEFHIFIKMCVFFWGRGIKNRTLFQKVGFWSKRLLFFFHDAELCFLQRQKKDRFSSENCSLFLNTFWKGWVCKENQKTKMKWKQQCCVFVFGPKAETEILQNTKLVFLKQWKGLYFRLIVFCTLFRYFFKCIFTPSFQFESIISYLSLKIFQLLMLLQYRNQLPLYYIKVRFPKQVLSRQKIPMHARNHYV